MEALSFTSSTIILLLIILVCVGLAIRRLARRGMCDCGDHCESGNCRSCRGCSCEAVEQANCPIARETVSKLSS